MTKNLQRIERVKVDTSFRGFASSYFEIILRIAAFMLVANLGSRIFSVDANAYFVRAEHITWHHLPYRDFLWEYPPLAALALVLIPLTGRNFQAFAVTLGALMIAIEYWSLCRLRSARPEYRNTVNKFWMLAVFPMVMLTWLRLDLVPVALAVLAIIALSTGRRFVTVVVAGFAVKLWPAVFVLAMVAARRWRDAALAVGGCFAVVFGWWLFFPKGFSDFLHFRAGEGFQIESLPGSLFLLFSSEPLGYSSGAVIVDIDGWTWVNPALALVFGLLSLAALLLGWKASSQRLPSTPSILVALMGAVVAASLLSTRLLSPQFVVWLAPFVAWLWPLGGHARRAGLLYGGAAWITLVLAQSYGALVDRNIVLCSVLLMRNVLLVLIMVELMRFALQALQGNGSSGNGTSFDDKVQRLLEKGISARRTGRQIVLFLDFDGSLSMNMNHPERDFAAQPDGVAMRPRAREALQRLSECDGVRPVIVSGRTLASVAPLVPEGVDIYAQYGAVGRIGGKEQRDPRLTDPASQVVLEQAVETVRNALTELGPRHGMPLPPYEIGASNIALAARSGRVGIEEKEGSISVHFAELMRQPGHNPEVLSFVRAVADAVRSSFVAQGLSVNEHNGAIEFGWPFDKTVVMKAVVETAEPVFVVQVGDDLGDLEAAKLLRTKIDEASSWVDGEIVVVKQHPAPGRSGTPQELLAKATVLVESGGAEAASKILLEFADVLDCRDAQSSKVSTVQTSGPDRDEHDGLND